MYVIIIIIKLILANGSAEKRLLLSSRPNLCLHDRGDDDDIKY